MILKEDETMTDIIENMKVKNVIYTLEKYINSLIKNQYKKIRHFSL